MISEAQVIEYMRKAELDDLQTIMKSLSDDVVWRPICEDENIKNRYNLLYNNIMDSQSWDSSRNKEKGSLLEEFSQILFSRFSCVKKCETNLKNIDNEIDVNILFTEQFSPPFINERKRHFIVECKNKGSSSVDVGMVSKLVELCEKNEAGLGIFISHKGISGKGWKYGEGKRKKLFLSNKVPLISFKIEELEKYQHEGTNFYSDITTKYSYLVDEIDDNSPILSAELTNEDNFSKFLKESVHELKKKNLITSKEEDLINSRIDKKYNTIS